MTVKERARLDKQKKTIIRKIRMLMQFVENGDFSSEYALRFGDIIADVKAIGKT